MLSRKTPARMVVFDLLIDDRGSSLLPKRLIERRRTLEGFYFKYLAQNQGLELSRATNHPAGARRWLKTMRAQLDGIVAKRLDQPYTSSERAMLKIKTIR